MIVVNAVGIRFDMTFNNPFDKPSLPFIISTEP